MTKLNSIVLGIKLASKGFENYRTKYKRNQIRKVLFHTLLNLKFANNWFNYIKSDDFYTIYSYRPRIYIKPFRPYLSTKFDKKKKVEIILNTYQFLKEKKIFNTILKEPIIISHIEFNKEYAGELVLGYDERFRKEGELVLTFRANNLKKEIVSLAFSFTKNQNGEWDCLIGCVQGYPNKENFKLFQKLLYGMRPNSFVVFALQEIVKNLSCENILSAGSKIQVNRKKHFINISKFHKIHFNYDKFYEEIGGIKSTNEWYILPLSYIRKELKDVKTNKRNLYKKRYKLLDDISLQIRSNIKSI